MSKARGSKRRGLTPEQIKEGCIALEEARSFPVKVTWLNRPSGS